MTAPHWDTVFTATAVAVAGVAQQLDAHGLLSPMGAALLFGVVVVVFAGLMAKWLVFDVLLPTAKVVVQLDPKNINAMRDGVTRIGALVETMNGRLQVIGERAHRAEAVASTAQGRVLQLEAQFDESHRELNTTMVAIRTMLETAAAATLHAAKSAKTT